jgi:hypothetical protein
VNSSEESTIKETAYQNFFTFMEEDIIKHYNIACTYLKAWSITAFGSSLVVTSLVAGFSFGLTGHVDTAGVLFCGVPLPATNLFVPLVYLYKYRQHKNITKQLNKLKQNSDDNSLV